MWEFHRSSGTFEPDLFWQDRDEDPAVREFAERIVNGVIARIAEVDQLIRTASLNWRIDRMATVDRNVLRLATYELLDQKDTPVKVVLNEAIELSKRFGTEDSSSFVNGVLDKVASLLKDRADEPASDGPRE